MHMYMFMCMCVDTHATWDMDMDINRAAPTVLMAWHGASTALGTPRR